MGRFLAFFGVVMSLTAGLHYYVWARLVRDTHLPQPWPKLLAIAITLLGLSLPATFVLRRGLGKTGLAALHWVAFVWMGMIFILVVLLAGSDLVKLLALIARKVGGVPAPDLERRRLIGRVIGGLVATLASGIGLVALRNGIRRPRVREVKVALPRLPAAAHGMTLVQLTDIHLGPTIGRAFIEDLVTRTNALAPDVVCITGDLVDASVEELRDAVAPLARLEARHGVFFVTGNHEYYSGVLEWMVELERLGVRVLRNAHVRIGDGDSGFDLAGIDDYSAHGFVPGHGPDLRRALDGRDAARALVLMAHQPRAVWEAAELGVGLQLSGHTHGGQIFPFNYLVKLQQPFIRGLHRVRDTFLYVSCGTGYWGPPMRLGTEGEITRVVLEAIG